MSNAGRRWLVSLALALAVAGAHGRARRGGLPGGRRGYHNYAEVTAETRAIADAYPALVRRISIGKSYEGATSGR